VNGWLRGIGQKRVIVFFTVFALTLIVLQSPSFLSNNQFVKADSTAHPWSTFRNGYAHAGTANATGPAATPGELWRFSTGSNITSSPAVVNGTVYFGAGNGNV